MSFYLVNLWIIRLLNLYNRYKYFRIQMIPFALFPITLATDDMAKLKSRSIRLLVCHTLLAPVA